MLNDTGELVFEVNYNNEIVEEKSPLVLVR